jgi:3-dehydroquinate dehydratase
MEQMTLTQAVNEISQALATLEVAKEECKDVVEATLDAYFGDTPAVEDKKSKAARKTERKNIVKLARAMMKGEKDVAQEEAENMASLIEELG